MDEHDVAIIGAGVVGTTLALALARAGARVALVEATGEPEPTAYPADSFDLRVSALSPASIMLLDRLGVWSRLPVERRHPYRRMRVWDSASRARIEFSAGDIGLSLLGCIIEQRELIQALDDALALAPGVRVYRPVRLHDMRRNEQDVRVSLLQDSPGHASGPSWLQIGARLVVGADGSRSRVRALAEIGAREHAYEQSALVSSVRFAREHGYTAWQRFLPDGPLALLPLHGHWVSIVWSTTPAHADALREMPATRFLGELSRASEGCLGDAVEEAGRGVFGLRHLQAHRYVDRRLALVGDAAHTIHPLAGQGVNQGLLDVVVLTRQLAAQLRRGRDPGLLGNLRPYERERRIANRLVGDAMSGFNNVFRSRSTTLRLLRGTGFRLADRLPPLKRWFMYEASGLATLADGQADEPAFAGSPADDATPDRAARP
ncbi:MAG: UbiH/UbiF/VisC/COQ6 family ubiquinone biosynthesis hydroxylase [Gammaproteobacteria bacterium]|nr:UbiH/UbiF/VisC/COQ6 family ubiquinone biosynthesis hydroxylase [Gammaproteobacteria bacterium]